MDGLLVRASSSVLQISVGDSRLYDGDQEGAQRCNARSETA
jgi:hypothetical protein